MNDKSKYMDMFIEEATELFNKMNDSLTVLEKSDDSEDAINSLFRGFHSIKGMAASLNLRDIQIVSHKLEDLLHELRSKTIDLSEEIANILYDGIGTLEKMLRIVEEGKDEKTGYEVLVGRILTVMQATRVGVSAPAILPEKKTLPADLSQADFAELARENKPVLHVELTISPDSVSPPARAYLIVEMLREESGMLKTFPGLDDIGEWDFSKPFKIYLATARSKSEVEGIVNSSIEVQKFSVDEIEVHPAARKYDSKRLYVRGSEHDEDKHTLPKYRKPGAVKVDTPVLDSFIDIVGEMFIQENQLLDIAKLLKAPKIIESINGLEKLVRKFYKEVMALRLVPVTLLSDMMPRVIRELTSNSGKKVDLEVHGGDIKLDRSIIEKLGDPVIHIIRNCLDHGLESSEERVEAGKPEKGKLTFTASRRKDVIIIEISDDGRGLNLEKIKERAIACGMAAQEEIDRMSVAEINNFIMVPGFSTAQQITDVSGRGVGMDIIKTAVENLGGKLSVTSVQGQGSAFIMEVPLTMAIINTFRIKLNDDIYAIPIGKVVRTIEIPRKDLEFDNNKMSFEYQEETVPVFNLRSMLEYNDADISGKKVIPILLVENDYKRVGFVVDSFVAGYETVVKPLGPPLEKIEIYTGATMSEKGEVILLLDIDRLLKGVAL